MHERQPIQLGKKQDLSQETPPSRPLTDEQRENLRQIENYEVFHAGTFLLSVRNQLGLPMPEPSEIKMRIKLESAAIAQRQREDWGKGR